MWGPGVEDIIATWSSAIAQVTSLPASVWLSAALAILLGIAGWRYIKLRHELHATEDRVLRKLVLTQLKTWEPVGSNLEANAETSELLAHTSTVGHLVVLSSAVEAKMSAQKLHDALAITKRLLTTAVHTIATPRLGETNSHTCSSVIIARLRTYPDLTAATANQVGESENFLRKLYEALKPAEANTAINDVRTHLMDTAYKINPEFDWQDVDFIAE